jgi:hypothetical protein
MLRITWKLLLLQQYTFGSLVCISAKWVGCLNNVVDIKDRKLSAMSYHILSYHIISQVIINFIISIMLNHMIIIMWYFETYHIISRLYQNKFTIFTNNTMPNNRTQMPLKTDCECFLRSVAASILMLIRY